MYNYVTLLPGSRYQVPVTSYQVSGIRYEVVKKVAKKGVVLPAPTLHRTQDS